MNILILDDNERNARNTESKIISQESAYREITPNGRVKLLFDKQSKKELTNFLSNDFFAAVSSILKGSEVTENGKLDWIDEFDVLMIDNNLTDLSLSGVMLTAESIIGYLRAFTDVPYIISLNKNPLVDFDLRYLFGDYQSISDLALNSRHLSSRKLWGEKSEAKFSPWYWPHIKAAVKRRREQIDFVASNLENSVWETLGFPSMEYEYLSLRARSRFLPDIDIRETSFIEFFKSSHILPPAEIEKINKLANKGNELARKAIYRISAYEVDRWLRRDVLAAQDVLIDLPHLLAQMPFLLGDKVNNIECWNAALEYKDPPFGLNEKFYKKHLIAAHFSHNLWVSGPCFWWPLLKADDDLVKLFFGAKRSDCPDAVFCEDVSNFVSVTGTSDSPKEFEADIDGSWIRRYVMDLRDWSYSPRRRIIRSNSKYE